ncbi:MAG TPA: hypothetical protein VII06_38110 [Chloroflexota bacterium]|jgi:hypothetical protein
MATLRKSAPADDPDAFQSGAGASLDAGTDCAVCHAPLPEGHRYVCAACAEDSRRRAEAILGGLRDPDGHAAAGRPMGDTPELAEDDPMECPTCGMPLDASGRCAGCVTTVRR